MKLILAEKPSLAKNIANALNINTKKDGYFENNEYIVSFAFGHLFSLKDISDYTGENVKWHDIKLPFFPAQFKFKLKDDVCVKKQYNILKDLINRNDVNEIINCGDADREGQIIIDLILISLNNKKTVKRLWLPEQTEETIQKQINICEDNTKYKNLYNEGLARTYIDWLFGINLTIYSSVKANTLLPCGRVLIPIVNHIYDRDIAIKNFKPEKYYILESKTKIDNKEIILSLKNVKYTEYEKSEAEQKAKELNKYKARVTDVKNKEIKKQPPKLFSLSKLQSKLSKDNKISFAKSMEIIQSLYEKGYITYPRTNTEYLAKNEKSKIENLIKVFSKYNLEMKNTKTIFDDSKIESHSAILPTTKIPTELKNEEELIYNTVLNRFISNFLIEDNIINQTEVKISVNDQIFDLKGQIIKQAGFLQYEPQKIENNLPNFYIGQEFNIKFLAIEKFTTPPKKITEESLSNFLKNPFRKENTQEELENDDNNTIDDAEEYKNILKGVEIGTEATRTRIIENAKKYQYIIQDKQNFSITEKGIYYIKTLKKLEIDLFKEKTVETSILQKQVYSKEITLDECIEKIQLQINEIIKKDIQIEKAKSQITDSREIIGICPHCKRNVYESEKSYYCDGFKDKENTCNFTIWKENKFFTDKGKKLTKTMVKNLLKKGYIDVKGFKSKDKNKEYDARVKLKNTGKYINFILEFNNSNNQKKY